MRILVLFAHPAYHRSRVQRALANAGRDLDGVTFHDLFYEEYWNFAHHAQVYRQRLEELRHGIA